MVEVEFASSFGDVVQTGGNLANFARWHHVLVESPIGPADGANGDNLDVLLFVSVTTGKTCIRI
jgi:hypothetical protein